MLPRIRITETEKYSDKQKTPYPDCFNGIVSSVNYVKNFGLIKYSGDNEQQEIIFFLSSHRQFELQKQGTEPAGHHFWVGDVVEFTRKPSGKNDGSWIARDVRFKNNPSLHELVQKAKINNHFFGQFIKSGDNYFVKELLTEIIFPLEFIEYEAPPVGDELTRNAYFRIINMHDSKKRAAELIEKRFININENPEYHLHHGTVFDARVTDIMPKHIELLIPFFSRKARIDTANCKKEFKKQYSLIKYDERLRVKLHLVQKNTIFVKIADDAL